MNRHFIMKVAGAAALSLMLHPAGFAQSTEDTNKERPEKTEQLEKKEDPDKLGEYDEIIIRRKSDKNAKVTIEIRGDQVFVDGGPVSKYDNDTLSIRKKKIRVMDGRNLSFARPMQRPNVLIAPEPPDPPRFNEDGSLGNDEEGLPGEGKHAFLGVYFEKTDKEDGGAKVKEVTKGSAAEKGGLKPGDIITRVDDIKIAGPDDLPEAIKKYKPQDKVTITYQRDGKEQKKTVVLGAGKNQPGTRSIPGQPFRFSMPDMGDFDFRNLPPNAPGGSYRFGGGSRPKMGIHAQDTEDGKGVKIIGVDEGSAAEKAGIKEGDIITRYDGKEVNSAGSLAEIARAGRDKTTVKISVTHNGKSRELDVKIPKQLQTADL